VETTDRMANPNPNPATRFSSENQPEKSGRPQGSRDRLSKEFMRALSDDFETHGSAVIETVRTSDPSTYLRVVAGLQRQEIELHTTPEERLKEDELEYVYQRLLAGRPEPAAEPAPVVAKGSGRVN
jgi:hypothetical protein